MISEPLLDTLERELYDALEEQGPDVPYVGTFRFHGNMTTLDGEFNLRDAVERVIERYDRAKRIGV